MADFFESKFGSGLMAGVGGAGLAVALAESPTNWLFVTGATITLLGGLVVFCMLKTGSHERDDI